MTHSLKIRMKLFMTFLAVLGFSSLMGIQAQPTPLREATIDEMAAGVQGLPAVVTPRRAGSGDSGVATNAIYASQATNLAFLPEVWVFSNGFPANNVTTFTNAQAAINAITSTNNSIPIVQIGNGTYIYPPVGGTVHFAVGEWFLPTNILISVPYNSALHLTGAGALNSRLIAPSRVFTITNNSQNLNFYLEIDHLGMFATNVAAKDTIIYENMERLNLHDFILTRYSALLQTNTSELAWGGDCFTNATGLIGIYSSSALNKHMIHDGVFSGLAHDILDESDHSIIYNNDFGTSSGFRIKNGATILNTNLWIWTDTGFGRFSGAELTAGFSVGLADHGDLAVYNNHFFESTIAFYSSVLQRSQLYGIGTFYGNRFEGSSARTLDFALNVTNTLFSQMSFYDNYDVGTSGIGSTVGGIDLTVLASVTNIVLTGWTPTYHNGNYKINLNASTVTPFSTFMIWTNVANSNNFITMNDLNTGTALAIMDSTNYALTTEDFFTDAPAYPILLPTIAASVWTVTEVGGIAGSFNWGTNQMRLGNPVTIASNLNVYANGNFVESNGTFSVLVKFSGSGFGLTNLLGAITTYSTNATLVAATSLRVNFTPFADLTTNYTISSPNDLVGATVTARTPTNFTLGFTSATITSQIIEGGIFHR